MVTFETEERNHQMGHLFLMLDVVINEFLNYDDMYDEEICESWCDDSDRDCGEHDISIN